MMIRKTTSMTLLISFVFLMLSSVVLYIVPHGRVAYWSNWHLWGLSKTQWGNVHITLGFFFVFAGIVHIFYNWKSVVRYLKNRSKQLRIFTVPFNLALVMTIMVIGGTLLNIPPLSMVIELGETIKDRAAQKYGEPPYGHAELSPLSLFARRTGMDLNKAMANLKKQGVRCSGSGQTIADIAKANALTPKALFAIMQSSPERGEAQISLPAVPPPGFGRITMVEICRKYQLDLQKIYTTLQQQGLVVETGKTFKDMAEQNQLSGHELYNALYEAATE